MKISSSFGIEIGMQQLIKNGRKCLLQNIIDTIPFGVAHPKSLIFETRIQNREGPTGHICQTDEKLGRTDLNYHSTFS